MLERSSAPEQTSDSVDFKQRLFGRFCGYKYLLTSLLELPITSRVEQHSKTLVRHIHANSREAPIPSCDSHFSKSVLE
jgi:hypothetical protein